MAGDISAASPEARAAREERGDKSAAQHRLERLGVPGRVVEVAKRVVLGVFADGFVHAGNLAYLTLLTLFPFFIVTAAAASLLGHSADTQRAVASFLLTLPEAVRTLLAKPIHDVLTSRTGSLLWIGAGVGLWTVGSYIETVRDILRRAYGVQSSQPFWRQRLWSIGLSVGAVVLMMFALAAQVILVAAEQFIDRLLPFASDIGRLVSLGRLVPLLIAWGALYLLFWTLTPSRYRHSPCPKWPGALLVALWWYSALGLLPVVLARFANYDLTYGSLAGVIVALLFFFLIGLGLVIGGQLNAALAEVPRDRLGTARAGETGG